MLRVPLDGSFFKWLSDQNEIFESTVTINRAVIPSWGWHFPEKKIIFCFLPFYLLVCQLHTHKIYLSWRVVSVNDYSICFHYAEGPFLMLFSKLISKSRTLIWRNSQHRFKTSWLPWRNLTNTISVRQPRFISTVISHIEGITLDQMWWEQHFIPWSSSQKHINQSNHEKTIRQISVEGYPPVYLIDTPQHYQGHQEQRKPKNCHSQEEP